MDSLNIFSREVLCTYNGETAFYNESIIVLTNSANKDAAIKFFTLLQGKEWTGGEVFDDDCM